MNICLENHAGPTAQYWEAFVEGNCLTIHSNKAGEEKQTTTENLSSHDEALISAMCHIRKKYSEGYLEAGGQMMTGAMLMEMVAEKPNNEAADFVLRYRSAIEKSAKNNFAGFDGDVHSNFLFAVNCKLLVVYGDLVVDGNIGFNSELDKPWLIVLGDVKCRNLVMKGDATLCIGGSLIVDELLCTSGPELRCNVYGTVKVEALYTGRPNGSMNCWTHDITLGYQSGAEPYLESHKREYPPVIDYLQDGFFYTEEGGATTPGALRKLWSCDEDKVLLNVEKLCEAVSTQPSVKRDIESCLVAPTQAEAMCDEGGYQVALMGGEALKEIVQAKPVSPSLNYLLAISRTFHGTHHGYHQGDLHITGDFVMTTSTLVVDGDLTVSGKLEAWGPEDHSFLIVLGDVKCRRLAVGHSSCIAITGDVLVKTSINMRVSDAYLGIDGKVKAKTILSGNGNSWLTTYSHDVEGEIKGSIERAKRS